MRILSWVQTKINGGQEKKRFEAASARNYAIPDNHKEEFSGWPDGLLAIGTFGNSELKKEPHRLEAQENSHSLQDPPEFTLDEVNKLEKQLTKLLSLKSKCKASDQSEAGKGHNSKPSDKFLNCPSSLEVDRLTSRAFCDKVENGETGDLSPNTKIILNRAKDLLADNRNAIGQKSISFLLKKMLVCRGGFAPAPSPRDPISESRIEKLLKTILHRKIYPQNSAPMTVKKYLEKRRMSETEMRDKILMMMREKTEEKADDGCKWVKTDSECTSAIFMYPNCSSEKASRRSCPYGHYDKICKEDYNKSTRNACPSAQHQDAITATRKWFPSINSTHVMPMIEKVCKLLNMVQAPAAGVLQNSHNARSSYILERNRVPQWMN